MQQPEKQCHVSALDHLVLTVRDLSASIRFYTDVLGMRGLQFDAADGTKRWALQFGQNKINLHQHHQEFEPKAMAPTPGSADLCLLTEAPLEHWMVHLAAHKVDLEEGPVARSGATGPITSLYVRDPDGNLIEVSVAAD